MSGASVPVRLSVISAGKFRRYKHFRIIDYITTPSVMFRNLLDISKILFGTLQALWTVLRFRPDVIFAKGGFVCLPVGWASRLCGVPLVIHDSDARPGLTNRLLASFARSIATGYPLDNYSYDRAKSVYTGVPIRHGGRAPLSRSSQIDAKRSLGIDAGDLLIVGVGGGLGARSINTALVRAAKELKNRKLRSIIVSGAKNYTDTVKAAEGLDNVRVIEFVSEGMMELLSAADIVVTRASATSLQELASLQKAIIAVPARQLTDQHENAKQYEKKHAAIVLEDDELDVGRLTDELVRLIDDDDARSSLASALHGFARPNAARDVARLIIQTTQKNR